MQKTSKQDIQTQRVLVANLATDFWILVASTIILVALATVLGAILCPVYVSQHIKAVVFAATGRYFLVNMCKSMKNMFFIKSICHFLFPELSTKCIRMWRKLFYKHKLTLHERWWSSDRSIGACCLAVGKSWVPLKLVGVHLPSKSIWTAYKFNPYAIYFNSDKQSHCCADWQSL